MENLNITKTDALIIVDPQNDFMPGGSLAVAEGDAVIPGVNELIQQFKAAGGLIAITQDWHPQGHKSFASAHDVAPFSAVELSYGSQVAWPDHCVQNTSGADFHNMLAAGYADVIIRKGQNPNVDSYSAFYENDKVTKTGLAGYLRDKGIRRCIFVGLAYDFCVGYSAVDARGEKFEAIVLKDLTRAINMPSGSSDLSYTTVTAIEEEFRRTGVVVA